MSKVLILCPTFDHAETLFASTASVRTQTFTNWELVVIGDGAPNRTNAIMEVITEADPRIRYEGHPKSERFGEIYRDCVIRDSAAEVVMQLGDDDLWAPDHIECMLETLEHGEWANQAPLRLHPDGTAQWWPINHGTAAVRSSITRGVPVSAGPNFVAYRREAYLRLHDGWTCAPPGGPSDAFMWAKFFRLPSLPVASTAATTAIKLPSHVPGRERLDSLRRLAELQTWLARIARPGLLRQLCAEGSIHSRLLDLFHIHGVPPALSWEQALRLCGMEPVACGTPPRPARNGECMILPLSANQLLEASRAWEKYQEVVAKDPALLDAARRGAKIP
jgi:hypothetical protein